MATANTIPARRNAPCRSPRPRLIIAVGKKYRAGRHDQERKQDDHGSHFLARRLFCLAHSRGTSPLPDQRKKDWFAVQGCRFDSQRPVRSRPGAGPCRARIGIDQWIPYGRSGMKLRRIDPGSRQKQIPIRRLAIPAIAGTKLVASPRWIAESPPPPAESPGRAATGRRDRAGPRPFPEIAMGGSPG